MPSRNPPPAIPVLIVVNGVEVSGEIVSLRPNDMSVVIRSPVSGLGTGVHIPWFKAGYPQFQLVTEAGISPFGEQYAKDLLRELYEYAGRPSGWGVSSIGPDGDWKPLHPPGERL